MIKDRLRKKLKSKTGESISETLVALLIAALALVMLAAAMSSVSSVIFTSRDKLEEYYKESDKLANMSDAVTVSGGITMKDESGSITFEPYDIEYYKNDEFDKTPVVTYKYIPDNGD